MIDKSIYMSYVYILLHGCKSAFFHFARVGHSYLGAAHHDVLLTTMAAAVQNVSN